MKVLLLDTSQQMCEAWRIAFAGVQEVEVHHGSFVSVMGTFDCLVSPANSFGLMDGGIDASIIQCFGFALEKRVQDEIWRRFRGEQPIGTGLMVPTGDPRCPWLAHCPTMRVPMEVSRTNHAYAAFLAALTTAEAHGVKRLGCPGLGTGVGRMPCGVAAGQMRFALDLLDLWSGPPRRPDWEAPSEREWRSYGGSRADFLKEWVRRQRE